jgi:hypothetical protein
MEILAYNYINNNIVRPTREHLASDWDEFVEIINKLILNPPRISIERFEMIKNDPKLISFKATKE